MHTVFPALERTPLRPPEGVSRPQPDARSLRAAEFFPADSLLEPGRAARQPLGPWAAELRASLREWREGDEPKAWRAIAEVMNNAALIEVFRGELASAEQLCHLQLEWVAQLCRRHPPEIVAPFAFQPWVNLGRLCRIHKQYGAALQHFSLLSSARRAEPLDLGPVHIDAPLWRRWQAQAEVMAVLELIYLLDSTKTLLMDARPEAALSLIRSTSRDRGRTYPPCLESELIVFARQERYEEALRLAEDPGWCVDAYHELVRWTYRIALLVALGKEESAQRLLLQLVRALAGLQTNPPTDPRFCRTLLRLLDLARALGERDCMRSLCRVGLLAARASGDSPHELAMLEAHLACGEEAERAQHESERSALLAETQYGLLLGPRGLRVDPVRAGDPVFAELRQELMSLCSWRPCRA
jgi:hypothetical protein